MKEAQNEVTLVSHLQDYANCNLWANKTLVEWLKTKPAALMDEVVPSSFPSIRETLIHIWDVQQCWLGYIRQEKVKSFRMDGFDGTLDDVMEGIVKQSEELAAFVASLTDESIKADCSFSVPYVGDHTVPVSDILLHVFNHSSYHRGQITTIGRNVGLTDAPMTDYMFYLLRIKRAQPAAVAS